MQADLSWLIAPFGQEEFVKEHWGKRPMRIGRDDSAYYSRLLPETELEFVLHAAAGIKSLDILNEEEKLRKVRSHAQAVEAFREGSSLRVDSIQRLSGPIANLCRSVEQAIHCRVNVNMYLTPGAGKKALKRHFDTHDVFVLQIHGNKIWRLYDPPHLSPLEYLPLQRHESPREMEHFRLAHDMSGRDNVTLTEEFTLKMGDCLYLPRGFWHEAESTPGETSCHLTVGIQSTTYLDVVNVALSQSAMAEHRLREPLPFGFVTDPTAAGVVAARVAEFIGDISKNLDFEAALGEVSSHFQRISQPSFENNLLSHISAEPATEVTMDTTLRIRAGTQCRVDSEVDPAQMLFASHAFQIASSYEEACRFIAKMRSFKVSDLPGELDPAEKLVLVQQLISEGLLTTAAAGFGIRELERNDSKWLPVRLGKLCTGCRFSMCEDRFLFSGAISG